MPQVTLDDEEWQRVLTIIGTKEVWIVANPLLQKIGAQLERQKSGNSHAVEKGQEPDDDLRQHP